MRQRVVVDSGHAETVEKLRNVARVAEIPTEQQRSTEALQEMLRLLVLVDALRRISKRARGAVRCKEPIEQTVDPLRFEILRFVDHDRIKLRNLSAALHMRGEC